MSRFSFVAAAFRLALGVVLLQNCQPNHGPQVGSPGAVPISATLWSDIHVVERIPGSPCGAATLQKPPVMFSGAVADCSELTGGRCYHSSSLTAAGSAAPVYFGSFTASSGDRVVFKRAGDVWYAETCQGSLPVKSQEIVCTYLRWLRNQESCVVRARVHVMHASNEPHNRCVYLGKVGLLGGTRTPGSQRSSPGTLVQPAAVNAIFMAFGAKEWQRYLGVDVGEEPSLPENIDTILNRICPFLLEEETSCQKVKDNHLLVLIPATVNGDPFTLDKLGELIKGRSFLDNPHGYRYYSEELRQSCGSESIAKMSYWVLITKKVMRGSLGHDFLGHQRRISRHSKDGYRVPYALEVATAILTHYVRSGHRLYSDDPLRYTRCYNTSLQSLFIGGFDFSGLSVDHYYFDRGDYGVAGCREL